MAKQLHRVRYVLRTDGLVFVSVLDRPTPVSFVSQPAYFRRIAGISPRKTIGTRKLTDEQLRALGVLPARQPEEVTYNDARTLVG